MDAEGIMNFDISNILNISARICVAIFIVCFFLMFFPASWLPFEVAPFRKQYGLWIFIILVISVGLLLSYLIEMVVMVVIDKAKESLSKKQMRDLHKRILKSLSDSEKRFLKNQYDKKECVVYIPLYDPMMKHMQSLLILSIPVGTSIGIYPNTVPGFIQPWVFEVISKYPECIKIENEFK